MSRIPIDQSMAEDSAHKILLVDDNEDMLFVTSKLLSLQGFETVQASSARLALMKVDEELPDLILCDIMMPDMDGYEFRRRVMNNPESFDIPVIFLSGLSSEEDLRNGREFGCDDYLTKPFDTEDLLAVVRGKLALFGSRRKMRSLRLESYRRRIIHTLSHEFRTPLVSISTGTELLLERYEALEADKIKRLLLSIKNSGGRLESLVNDFMILQQIDNGQCSELSERSRQQIPLVELAETALSSFTELYPELQSRVELQKRPELDSSYPFVHVYDIQVLGSLQRLLENACKFSPAVSKVSVVVGMDGDRATISVRDRGPGLRDDEKRKALEVFSQIDRDTNEQQGCGLGLSIADKLVRINGGELHLLDPHDSKGLTVELRFPAVVFNK